MSAYSRSSSVCSKPSERPQSIRGPDALRLLLFRPVGIGMLIGGARERLCPSERGGGHFGGALSALDLKNREFFRKPLTAVRVGAVEVGFFVLWRNSPWRVSGAVS